MHSPSAEVLEARGGPLLEEEVWSLLLGTAESLVDVSYKGHNNMCSIISPTSLLLSATGTLAFKNCGLSDEVSTFAAPEMLQGQVNLVFSVVQMLVYSLGMTLYWSVDFHLPQNQPVQLSDHLNSLLLSMCEDLSHRRVNLNSILEACESHVEGCHLCVHVSIDKSVLSSFPPPPLLSLLTLRGHDIFSLFDFSNSLAQLLHNLSFPTHLSPLRIPRGARHRDSNCSWLGRSPHHDISSKTSGRSHSPSITFSDSSLSLSQRKAKVSSKTTWYVLVT
uniref:KIND domain-containing protein n=1 Tax=Amphilophus citrinellus TaxID=61819 RepID=A0A3Q0T442_AMPCI